MRGANTNTDIMLSESCKIHDFKKIFPNSTFYFYNNITSNRNNFIFMVALEILRM